MGPLRTTRVPPRLASPLLSAHANRGRTAVKPVTVRAPACRNVRLDTFMSAGWVSRRAEFMPLSLFCIDQVTARSGVGEWPFVRSESRSPAAIAGTSIEPERPGHIEEGAACLTALE